METKKTIAALEHDLDGKIMTGDFLINNYRNIPESDTDKKVRYQKLLVKHFTAISKLCDQLEESLEFALFITKPQNTQSHEKTRI
ncbi:hypothetical protein [Pseudopedobacter beijingensis]|uniref:Uncharacterized protein n=1 Tax=Pseudopedobacter beijingensis TaxID=1207056 RepID=A0ABW4II13_9SPHI